MGARLALNRPSDRLTISPYGSPSDGFNTIRIKPLDSPAEPPYFGLLGPSEEDRKRRRLVLGLSPCLEALAIGVMLWALMSLPPTPVLSTVKQEVLYFHPISPAEIIKHPPTLLKQPVLPKQVVTRPITPKLQ
ncbi:MAG: hypothetical protein EPN47_01620, partial [Acidobacteria bacterium]